MAKQQISTSEYAVRLDRKEIELLMEKSEVFAFLDTEHKAEATKKYLQALRKSEAKIDAIMGALLRLKAQPAFREEAEKLCGRCRELGAYTRDMNRALADDLIELRPAEDKSATVIENVTFFMAPPLSFFAAVKSGFGDGLITPDQAAGAGLTVSTTILFRKAIAGAFRKAGSAVCEIPRLARTNLVLCYLRETTAENIRAVGSAFKNCTGTLTAGIAKPPSGRKKLKRRSIGRKQEP